MFPEYRELISKLKTSDHHFEKLFDQHNELDEKIANMESRVTLGSDGEIESLKREKLRIKDELFAILRKANGET